VNCGEGNGADAYRFTKVLDHGFVRLVEGPQNGDIAVVRAARVSYGSGAKTPAEDKKIIAYLLNHDHGSPFEMAHFIFHVKVPILVMRQWIRHRIASYNEISFRYTHAPDEFYIPEKFRAQDTKNKQGSLETKELDHELARHVVENVSALAYQEYKKLLELGVAREMARMVLPVNIYTEFYWAVNARSLMNFLSLRCEDHAQYETRQFANALAPMFAQEMPWTYAAFVDSLSPEARKKTQEGKRYATLTETLSA
jgi:thymidylate synthase (FAD)